MARARLLPAAQLACTRTPAFIGPNPPALANSFRLREAAAAMAGGGDAGDDGGDPPHACGGVKGRPVSRDVWRRWLVHLSVAVLLPAGAAGGKEDETRLAEEEDERSACGGAARGRLDVGVRRCSPCNLDRVSTDTRLSAAQPRGGT